MDVLDQPLVTSEQRVVQYAGFGVRLGAMIIDSLIIGVVTLAATYYNIFTAKSTLLLIIVTLVSTAYKPLMEYFFGATVGKMALRLKVVNTQLDRADFSEIFLRNIFNIIPSLITLVLTV
ncbi:MAG TPA: RDD family protein, partial [Chryseosolibacter sp.]|nr:RDD family protein [Chryseosolibacter sp.]